MSTEKEAEELAASSNREDWGKAATIYQDLLSNNPSKWSAESYQKGLFVVKMKLASNETINESTQAVLDSLDNDLNDELNWKNVDIAQVCAQLMTKNLALSLENSQIGENTYILCDAIHKTHPEWLEPISKQLKPNLFYGVMGGDMWDPRVLPNGGVLIRNYHRVIGLSYVGTVRVDSTDALIKDLEKIKEIAEDIYEDEYDRFLRLWVLNATPNPMSESAAHIVCEPNFSTLNRAGNCLVGIGDIDTLAACDILTVDLLESHINSSRGGIAIRIFEGAFHVYTTSRWSDELDFLIEEATVHLSNEGYYSTSHSHLQNIATFTRQDKSSDVRPWDAYNNKLNKYIDGCLGDTIQYRGYEDIVSNLPKDVQERCHAESPVTQTIQERITHTMTAKLKSQISWCTPIFASDLDVTASYHFAQSKEAVATWKSTQQNPVILHFNVTEQATEDMYDELLERAEIEALLEEHGLDLRNARWEIVLPPINDLNLKEEWVELNDEGIGKAYDRHGQYLDTLDDEEDEYYYTQMGYLEGTSGEYKIVRLHCDLQKGSLHTLNSVGRALSNKIEEYDLGLSGVLYMSLPPFGLVQCFEYGNLDSGNIQ